MALTKVNVKSAQSKGTRPVTPVMAKAKLLYVEDNDANWDIALLLLKGSYELTRARTAREVIETVSQSEFDIILMDIELAGSDLDGIELTRLLRGRLDSLPEFAASFKPIETPIIFVTAYTARYKDAELKAYGGDAVVHKPVNPDELTGAIWKILNDHRVATIAAQKSQLEAEKAAREIQQRAFQEIQTAHEKLSEELRIRKEVEGELEAIRDELQEAGLKLKEAQKLATYGELLASIAHEINTPLSGGDVSAKLLKSQIDEIESTFASLLGEDESEEAQKVAAFFREKFEKARESTQVVQLSYSKLKDISDALRMGSRKSVGVVSGVDLNQVVEQSLVLAAGRIRVFDPEVVLGNLPEISCQPNYLGQVVINLLTNAADAMLEHCEKDGLNQGEQNLRIETSAETFEGTKGVSLVLEDSGPGVPKAIRDKIFESFFTTKPHGVGTGLGLAISAKIIRDHHGVFEVNDSAALGGARFRFWLPISQSTDNPS